MPATQEHHAVIDLTQSDNDDDSQQSPSQLPGQPRSLCSHLGASSRLSRCTDHQLQQQHPEGQPKRRRLVQGGCTHQPPPPLQQQQQGSSTAFDFELEDDGELLQGAGAEEMEGLGGLAVGRGQSQQVKSSSRLKDRQHQKVTEIDRGKRGRAAKTERNGVEDWRAGSSSRGRCKPSARRDVSSSPEWAASSDSEEEDEEKDDDEEEEEEKEEVPKRGRKRGQGRAKEAPVPVSKRSKGAAASKGKGGSPPAKGPLQLTLSQCARPLSQLLEPSRTTSGANLSKQPPSSQQATPACIPEGHARADSRDGRKFASSPSRHSQLPTSSSQQQLQLPLSQRSGTPPSPTRPPLQLTRTLQQQDQQLQAQRGEQPGRTLPRNGSMSNSMAAAGRPAATAKAVRKSSPCPSSAAAACDEGGGALWYDKHAPADTSALAVHRKKVDEVRDFLQRQEQPGYTYWGSRMLIASGPAGCGKSTSVRLLASELGYHVVEYNPPTPTLWSELQQQDDPGPLRSLGPSYVSKLDDFEAFVNRAKYPALPLASRSSTAAQGTPTPRLTSSVSQHQHNHQQQQQHTSQASGALKKLLLIDDLPHVHDMERSRRLAACLADLAATARGPVVLICTQTSGSSSGGKEGGGNMATGGAKGLSKDVMSALESAGATLLNFNPITANSIVKVLQQVAAVEGCPLSPDAAAAIAGLADGDLRNALQTLQAMFAGHQAVQTQQGGTKRGGGKGARGKGSKVTKVGSIGGGLVGNEVARIASTQRDLGLDIFHALGKLLYNKRDSSDDTAAEPQQKAGTAGGSSKRGLSKAAEAAATAVAAVRKQAKEQAPSRAPWMPCLESMEDRLCPSLRRPPTKNDPEAIVTQSGLDPIQVAAFLHENYLNFIAEEAIEDVALAASYMSDAAYMACSRTGTSSSNFSGGFWGLEEPSTATNLAAACAGSVAARGLMFANTHPAPRRWTPFQAPAQTRAERARADNAERVQGTSACLALWHGTLAAGGCSAAVSAQVMPWLRTLACFPDYSLLSRVMPSSWCIFTMASSQNTVVNAPRPSSWGSSSASSGLNGQLQQMGWMQDQQAGLLIGSGDAGDVDASEEDPIDS